jgi:predicted Zn-dependent protease
MRRALPLLALLALASCSSGDVTRNLIGGATGQVAGDQRAGAVLGSLAGSAMDSARQVATKFSPEQEYYIGRAVAANAIGRWGLDPDPARQQYVRTVGAALVRLSARVPATYGGWTFAVLDSDEVNGVSGPGGYVLITRGALAQCRDEDELASIIAHEMAHVSLKHGEAVIRAGSGFQSSLGVLVQAAGAASSQESVRSDFSRFFGAVAEEATKLANEHAYGREAEIEADREAVLICYDTGYTGAALADFLARVGEHGSTGSATHTSASDRAAGLGSVIAEYGGPFDGGVGRAARAERFQRTLARPAP